MKVAIIGGGSAGLVTAHLLDGAHHVTVFEKAPVLGGHVRTLNRNVDCDLGPGLILDAGVIEFERRNFPTLMRLFDSLGCVTRPVPVPRPSGLMMACTTSRPARCSDLRARFGSG